MGDAGGRLREQRRSKLIGKATIPARRATHNPTEQEENMLGASSGSEWNDATMAALRSLWAEGHSTAEIGRRLGFSKNAIVGKAHRLNLAARPSPIRRSNKPRTLRPSRAKGPSLPALACLQHVATTSSLPKNLTTPTLPSKERDYRTSPARLGSGRCCWPIGEPGTRQFRFCDAPSAPGRPYCPEHVAVAYVKVRDRREEAA